MLPKDYETKALKYWKDNNIFEKLRKKNQGKKPWSFIDGPITANNPMGVHHAWGRTYKDLFQRYRAMQGFDERFQNGFDCQGLWVEVEVEKELGFKNKKDIEEYGIEKFVEKCKERVLKYSKIQTEQSIRLGQWMDWDNSYFTMSDENNYAIWHFLKKCWKDGLLYKGRDVVPWCPRCGTAISQHEILTEEYKEIVHKAIFVKLPIIGREKTFFLAWTTTPWTLPANTALAVHSELEYAEVKDKEGNVYVLIKDKAELVPEGEIIKTFKGAELEGVEYEGLFDELPAVKESLKSFKHKTILWKDISAEEGTGIVHIAPGCGQEDFSLSKESDIAVVDPTQEESRYREGFGELSGRLTSEVNDIIFDNLTKKERVFKIEDYKHRYPTCWRCKSELIFRLVDEWYISMDKIRNKLVENAKKINWIPSFGLDRELDWLKNMHDWMISKKRYWGLTLPIYECSKCGNLEVIGSKEELKERAVEGWEEFEGRSPHKPQVDKVKIKCSKCGETVSRIADVGNPWLDAGIVSFSTLKYFTDKDYWRKWFPADFICESFPGQFKNWFYSLIVMSVVLEGVPPSKTIFGYATVVDEKGEEMHKSKGNAIWFDDAIEKIGADVPRWMYAKQNPVANLKFGYNNAKEARRRILTLWNSYVFLKTYTSQEELHKVSGSRNLLDRWIASKLNNLIKQVTEAMDNYSAGKATTAIESFFIEDLSLWYVRRSRKRFQKPENAEEKQEAVSTLYHVILTLIKLIAPITPFLAEEMYSGLKTKDMPESVHLCDWPKPEEKTDSELEKKMEEVRSVVASALAERAKQGVKVRQPLSRLQIKGKILKDEKELLELIKEEVNVKEVIFGENLELDMEITSQLKEEGKIREIVRNVKQMRKTGGFTPKDVILLQFKGDPKTIAFLLKNRDEIKEEINAGDLRQNEEEFDIKKEIIIDGGKVQLSIKKVA